MILLERRIDGEDHFGIVLQFFSLYHYCYYYYLYHNYHDHPCHQDHLNDILRQSKDRCSNLAATADRIFRILQVLLNKGNVP